jgi:hypothetical protein
MHWAHTLRNDERCRARFRLLRHFLRLDPKFWETRYNYGIALLQKKAYPRALTQLQIAVEKKLIFLHS